MQVDILSWDKDSGKAKIKFSHNSVEHTDSYDLKLVVPGTDRVLGDLGMSFDETMQQRVIDKITEQVQRDIEAGVIKNPI